MFPVSLSSTMSLTQRKPVSCQDQLWSWYLLELPSHRRSVKVHRDIQALPEWQSGDIHQGSEVWHSGRVCKVCNMQQ